MSYTVDRALGRMTMRHLPNRYPKQLCGSVAVTVWTHKDTAGNPCPMSGKQAPNKWWQGIRAIPRERGDAAAAALLAAANAAGGR